MFNALFESYVYHVHVYSDYMFLVYSPILNFLRSTWMYCISLEINSDCQYTYMYDIRLEPVHFKYSTA